MADKLKEIPGKILEWWNKFTSRQKTIIIAIAAVVVFTFAIVVFTFTKPNYTRLGSYENSSTAAKVVEILDGAGVTHRESADALTVEVLTTQLAQANLAIAAEGYVPDGMPKYSDSVEIGMSTTSADRNNQYQEYLGEYMAGMFVAGSPLVKEAWVQVTLAHDSGRLSDTRQESYASIHVTVDEDFTSANAVAMAKSAATFLGNKSTANITIVDQNFNILFAGGDDYSSMGVANSLQELQNQASLWMTNQVRKVLLGTRQYDMIEVSSHLEVDFNTYTKQVTEYSAPDGRDN